MTVEHDVTAAKCLDCEAPMRGPYCLQCGQKAGGARLTLRTLLANLIGETFELDGRVPRTLVPFLFRPGLLTLEYNAGRRTRYTAPLRLFLALGVLWAAAGFSISQWQAFHPQDANGAEASLEFEGVDDADALLEVFGLEDTTVGAIMNERFVSFQALPAQERVKRVRRAASDVPPVVALLLFPVLALFLKLVLLGSGRTIPEHAIFALHVHAFGLFVITLLRVVGEDALIGVGMLWLGIYVLLALRRAYNLTWWGSLWRWSVISLFYLVISGSVFIAAVLGTAISD